MQPMDPPLLDPTWLQPYPDALLSSAYTDVAARYDRREVEEAVELAARRALAACCVCVASSANVRGRGYGRRLPQA